ncbi:MAG: hypothetical protein E7649_07575 [Ruminococcaceae bacterium]|nr:hypothetical protein [Oscillospiraceae bacterium]
MDFKKLLELKCGDVFDGMGESINHDQPLIIDANDVVIKNLTLGDICVRSHNVTLENCKFTAVDVLGEGFISKGNTVIGSIKLSGAKNALISQSSAKLIDISSSYNCSVVLNEADTISCQNNTNIYLIDNTFGSISLLQNDYLIADGNSFGKICSKDNTNINGDSVTDVNARPEVGANEDILPHTNKELFVGMKRRSTVGNTGLGLQEFIDAGANEGKGVIIIPPGAYSVYMTTTINATHSNNVIYAYGVYQEYAETDYKKFKGSLLEVLEAQNLKIYGLTMGEALPSSGQARVVEKIFEPAKAEGEKDVYKLRLINDAGFLDGFTTTDTDKFHTWWPEVFYSDDDGNQKLYCEENYKSGHRTDRSYDENGNYDGTLILTIKDRGTDPHSEAKPAKVAWDKVKVGNVITCRLNYGYSGSVRIADRAKNIKFRDTVIYGHACALSVLAGGRCEQVLFERHHNTVHSESVIDKETYEKYRAIEQKWGVDFEVRKELVEGEVRYRGPRSRTGSTDAFHVTKAKTGIDIKSSLLECMCDDGNNQHASSSRLHALKDNGDGTTTLYYKPLVTSVYWGISANNPKEDYLHTPDCANFLEGDRIYAYNPHGKPVIDAFVLGDAEFEGEELEYDLTYGNTHKRVLRKVYGVKVRTEDIDTEALIDQTTGKPFDLSAIGYEINDRVTVDNLSANSCNYTLDNVMVLNGHSRGFLIKATDITVKHCTLRNVCNAGMLITCEPEWGESTVARDIFIDRCLFDNTGHHFGAYQQPFRACIRIESTSKVASKNTLPINNITINKCRFTNNKQWNAIQVNSAHSVKITNNTFDPIVEAGRDNVRGVAVILSTCADVEISDNVYNLKNYRGDVRNVIVGQNYRCIHGTDVTDECGNPIFPDNVNE